MATDDRDSVPEEHHTLYQPGEPVWVGRSRGSEREGIVVRYEGEGFYRVYVVGQEGVRTLQEGLLRPRREGDGEQGPVSTPAGASDLFEASREDHRRRIPAFLDHFSLGLGLCFPNRCRCRYASQGKLRDTRKRSPHYLNAGRFSLAPPTRMAGEDQR